MNLENFSEYLENPYKLYQLSYEELKSLVLQYPYSSNLHLLLLEKSRLDQHKDFEKNLSRAAVYTFDRSFLYKKIHGESLQPVEKAQLILDEEILELKDLTSLRHSLEKIPIADTPPSDPAEARHRLLHPLPFEPVDDADLSLDFSMDSEITKGFHSPDTGDEEEEISMGEQAAQEDKEASAVPDEQLETPASSSQMITAEPLAAKPDQAAAGMEAVAFRIPDHLLGNFTAISEILARPEPEHTDPEILRPKKKTLFFPALNQIMQNAAAVSAYLSRPQQKSPPKAAASVPLEITNETPEAQDRQVRFAPMPKALFSSWNRQLKPSLRPDQTLQSAKWSRENKKPAQSGLRKEKNAGQPKVKDIVVRSISDHDEIASETLAELLVKQERYQQAAKMYERLILKFPEKSAFFAKKIEELKKI